MEKAQGIVLKYLSADYKKVSILTRMLGKVTVHLQTKCHVSRLGIGSIIDFTYKKAPAFSEIVFVTHVDVINIPVFNSVHHLYWLHHMLELAYYFIPIGAENDDALRMLYACIYLFATEKVADEELSVVYKITASLLLVLFGFYPVLPDHVSLLQQAQQAHLPFVDFIDDQQVQSFKLQLAKHALTADALHEWALSCIKSHPQLRTFKTIKFMYNIDTSTIR